MRRRRHGFSLVELTVVLTVLSLVWLSVTSVLYTLYRADHRLRDELQSDHAIDRFATRLRLDAHAAISADLRELAEESNELVLSTVDERSIHYGLSDEGVYRVVRDGEAVVHQDIFLISRVTGEWKLQSVDDSALVVVTLTSRPRRSQSAPSRTIKAAVTSAKATVVESVEAS